MKASAKISVHCSGAERAGKQDDPVQRVM